MEEIKKYKPLENIVYTEEEFNGSTLCSEYDKIKNTDFAKKISPEKFEKLKTRKIKKRKNEIKDQDILLKIKLPKDIIFIIHSYLYGKIRSETKVEKITKSIFDTFYLPMIRLKKALIMA